MIYRSQRIKFISQEYSLCHIGESLCHNKGQIIPHYKVCMTKHISERMKLISQNVEFMSLSIKWMLRNIKSVLRFLIKLVTKYRSLHQNQIKFMSQNAYIYITKATPEVTVDRIEYTILQEFRCHKDKSLCDIDVTLHLCHEEYSLWL